MKYISTFLLSIFFCGAFYGQKDSVEIRPGQRQKIKSAHFKNIVTADDKWFYTIGSSDANLDKCKPGAKFFLRKYSIENMALEKEWEIPAVKHKNTQARYLNSSHNKNGFHLLLEAFDSYRKLKYLIHIQVDKSGSYSSPKVLAVIKARTDKSRPLIVKYSKDFLKCAVFIGVEEEDEDQIPELKLFDEDFNLEWAMNPKTGLESDQILTVSDFKVTNSGNVVALAFYKKTSYIEGSIIVTESDLVALYNGNETPVTVDFNLGDKGIYSFELFQDIDDKLIIMGTYSEAKTNRPTGSFFIRLNQVDLTFESKSLEAFPESVINTLPFQTTRSENWQIVKNYAGDLSGGGRDGLRHVRYTDIASWPDGTYTAIAQRRYYRGYGGDPVVPAYYYFDDYVIVNLNSRGEILSSNVILLESFIYAAQVDYGGHYFHQGKDKVYILLNSNLNNIWQIKQGKDADITNLTGQGAIAIEIDKESKFRCTRAWDYGDLNYTRLYQTFYVRIDDHRSLAVFGNQTHSKVEFAEVTYP